MPELKIIISAENQKALEELKQLQDKLFQLQETVKNYKGDWPLTHTIETTIPRIQARITELQGTLSKAGVAFDNFGNNTEKIATGSNKAGLALNDLSRIVQDAPYGFVGISNNLNPMIESFGRLVEKEKGVKNALLSMTSSLVGPAGIGLAIGVVSSLLVVFSKQITEAFQKPTDKLKEFYDELNKINDKLFDIVGQAQANRTVGVGLVDTITGGGDTKTKEAALDKLKGIFKENADLQKATIANDKTFLLSLVNTASSQQEYIGKEKLNNEALKKIYSDRFKIEQERKDKLDELDKGVGLGFFPAGENAKQKRIDYLKAQVNIDIDARIAKVDSELPRVKDAGERIQKALSGFNFTNENSNKESKKALDEKIALLEYDIKKTLEWANEQERISNYVRLSARKAFTVDWADMLPSKKIDKAQAGLPDWFLKQNNQENPAEKRITDKELPDWYKKTIQVQNENSRSILNQYNEYKKFANLLSNEVTNALVSVWDTMQKGENPLDAIGNMFTKMAENIAAAIVQAYIFKAILEAFPELKGLFATIGVISSAVNYSGGQANGGITNGASLAMVGEAGTEAIMPLSKLSSMMSSTFNAGAMSGSSAGGSSQFVLRGQDLLLAVNRSQKASNIKGQSISLA